MSDEINVSLAFKTGKGGEGRNPDGYTLKIMQGESSARPYELLFMALGSCLYSTFEDVLRKMRISCVSTSIEISGAKRDEVPKFLQKCSIKFHVSGADKPARFEKAFEMACKYCSIYQTLSKVAEMEQDIVFTD